MPVPRKRAAAAADSPQPQSLESPGLPIMLTLAVRSDGTSQCSYLIEPQRAIQILREVADGIEKETSDS